MEHQSIFCEPMHVCIFHNEYEQLSCLSFELTTCGFISPEISSSDTQAYDTEQKKKMKCWGLLFLYLKVFV